MPNIVADTCRCGASVRVAERDSVAVALKHAAWLNAHAQCRTARQQAGMFHIDSESAKALARFIEARTVGYVTGDEVFDRGFHAGAAASAAVIWLLAAEAVPQQGAEQADHHDC